MRTKQSQANDSHRQKPQEHREVTTIKAKSKGNESHRSQGSNEKPWKPKLLASERNHGRLAPGFAADAWELRYSAVLVV